MRSALPTGAVCIAKCAYRQARPDATKPDGLPIAVAGITADSCELERVANSGRTRSEQDATVARKQSATAYLPARGVTTRDSHGRRR